MQFHGHHFNRRSMAGSALFVLLCAASQCGGFNEQNSAGPGTDGADGGPDPGGNPRGGSGGSSSGAGGTGMPGGGGSGVPGRGGSGAGGTASGVGGTGAGGTGSGVGGTGAGGAAAGGTGGATVPPPDPLADAAIDGPFGGAYEYKVHHPFRLTLAGPASMDSASGPNPFFDFRLTVTFKTPSGKSYVVPGYFAGDGKGGAAGSAWRVHFNPPEVGMYTYTVSFRSGPGIAIVTAPGMGTAMAPDAKEGKFNIGPTDKMAPDFRATGKVAYTKQHYLHTIGDGKVWLKTGSNSPENLFGYAEFSNTSDGPAGLIKNFLHKFTGHINDWKAGDPTWGNGLGKGIIGLVNYYAKSGVNEMGFMFQNQNGDGDDTIPWLSRTDHLHFDNVKLQQWEIVLSHAETKGVAIQAFTCEAENFGLVGLKTEGLIYYHELVARFAHHGGLMWNIGEENGFSNADRKGIAAYLMSIDPYRNPVADHTHAGAADSEYPPLMGDPNIVETSIQGPPAAYPGQAASFRMQSAAKGVPWVIMADEVNPAGTGVPECPTPGTASGCDSIRKTGVWSFLLSGGGGFEWYNGYGQMCNDVNCEDQHTHFAMYTYSRVAREFLQNLPLDTMGAGDNLVAGGKVWYKKGVVYAIYLPNGGSAQLDLSGDAGQFRVRFYNVINGMYGPATMVNGGGMVPLGAPPFPGDVAVLVDKM